MDFFYAMFLPQIIYAYIRYINYSYLPLPQPPQNLLSHPSVLLNTLIIDASLESALGNSIFLSGIVSAIGVRQDSHLRHMVHWQEEH